MVAAPTELEPAGTEAAPVSATEGTELPEPDWKTLLATAAAAVKVSTTAETFIKSWPTASRPVALRCADGNTYVVKGSNAGRQAVNDCIAAKLGSLVDAPVPPSALIAIPEELRLATPEMAHLAPGIAHGSRIMEDCTERDAYSHCNSGDNRARFGSVAIFYGWLGANDRQFIYGKKAPYRVYSADHGHFFGPGNQNWTIAGLAAAPNAMPDAETVSKCALTDAQLRIACRPLQEVTVEQIAIAVGSVPHGWAISVDEQIAMCAYLEKRRLELIGLYPAGVDAGEVQ